MDKNVFFSRYHVSVNDTLVEDITSQGYTLLMPDNSFSDKIWFFDSNEGHYGDNPNTRLISYSEWLTLPRMLVVIPCTQMIDDLTGLMKERHNIDIPVYLTAQSNSTNSFPKHGSDYVMSHDLYYHRYTEAKYKMFYFSRPTILIEQKKDLKACFDRKEINLYIHNFMTDGFELERPQAQKFSDLWLEKTGVRVKWFGHGCPEGKLSMEETQRSIVNSMFTFASKRRETWGQLVNESMLLYTPCIFLKRFLNSTFTEYEITKDNSVLVYTAEEAVEQILNMSFEQYETLCWQAKTTAESYCSDEPRRAQLKWLLDKAFEQLM